jgi:hypothetical protein
MFENGGGPDATVVTGGSITGGGPTGGVADCAGNSFVNGGASATGGAGGTSCERRRVRDGRRGLLRW